MQDRYVADIGDYVKFSILRALTRGCNALSRGVAWWLFPDEQHNADGGHREYLQLPHQWKRFGPDLFEALAAIVKDGKRGVHALESAGILPNAIFASDAVPCSGGVWTEV